MAAACSAGPAYAAEGAPALDGSTLSLWWVLPFAGLLLSVAAVPQFLPHLWHRHFGKVAAAWALLFLLPFAAIYGVALAAGEVLHIALLEYLPFVILLFALFVISGGIRIRSNLVGTPAINTGLLAFGAALASVTGTTGAAMLLVRPLIQANLKRRRNAHVLVFFIFLVANIGGSLTPLGDPPLFLGFLQGVAFGWTLKHMVGPMLLCSVVLLGVFYALDRWTWRRDGGPRQAGRLRIGFRSVHNVIYLAVAVISVLLSGVWKPGIDVHVWHVAVPMQSLARDAVLLLLAGSSWATTKRRVRIENAFTWGPDPGGDLSVCWHLPDHPARPRHPQGRPLGGAGLPRGSGDGTGRAAEQRRLLLAFGAAVVVPGQRADLPRVLQLGRRRPAGTHGAAVAHPAGDLSRLGVHGRHDLRRQRA